jgi:iron-sulfur cluster repair protein YtfE (RIC family)
VPTSALHSRMPAGAEADSVTALLSLDHQILDATLAEAKQHLAAGDPAAAAARFAAFRAGLEHHIEVEEEVLFPALQELTGGGAGGPVGVMRAEHTEIRRLLAEVAAALERNGAGAASEPLAALRAQLYAHNGKEERVLYPLADRAAGAAGRREALVRHLREF